MQNNSEFESISFDLPKNKSSVIKVIGVGGGGSNAINYMYKQGISGVDFIVCNTDSQALENSNVPCKIQLGLTLTEGLGAGANPDVGQQSAIESLVEIEEMLDCNTKMIFITAGMGGGTGTGAAPVIAELAKQRDIITVGIVTIPFVFEGKLRHEQALLGIDKLRKNVDCLIIINNNKLREVYGNLSYKEGFAKADEVLATAARGIAEVVTRHYTQNIDLRDARTVLLNSGTAIMGSAIASGINRSKEAVTSALDSPLLNDNKIKGAKNVLLLIVSGTDEIKIDEIGEISDYIQAEAGNNANIIMGVGEDENLGDAISVTVIATGFAVEQQSEIVNTEPKKIIHNLEEEQKMEHNLTPNTDFFVSPRSEYAKPNVEEKTTPELDISKYSTSHFEITEIQKDFVKTTSLISNMDVIFEIVSPDEKLDFTAYNSNIEEKPTKEVRTKSEQSSLIFDLPLHNKEVVAPKDNSFTSNSDMDISRVEFTPADTTEKSVIRHALEDENEANKATAKKKETAAEDDGIQFSVKNEEYVADDSAEEDEHLSPMNMSIEKVLKHNANERKLKLKEFNYKFHNSASKIDELEREPAYKRYGIDISHNPVQDYKSRISVDTDNNDLRLRSNNSFLHDNVD